VPVREGGVSQKGSRGDEGGGGMDDSE
jgi:hypothetical protein